MSREIKFRAWDKFNNRMISWGELLGYNLTNIFAYKSLEMLQYTGLKDKNGKEIYEGDILRCKCWDRKNFDINKFELLEEVPHFYRNSAIEWWQSSSNLGYRLRDGNGKTLMIIPKALQTMEVKVIGNIFEHPHLLEGTE